jgi:hypothetical protein
MPGCQDTRMPLCQYARIPGFQDATMPRCQTMISLLSSNLISKLDRRDLWRPTHTGPNHCSHTVGRHAFLFHTLKHHQAFVILHAGPPVTVISFVETQGFPTVVITLLTEKSVMHWVTVGKLKLFRHPGIACNSHQHSRATMSVK